MGRYLVKKSFYSTEKISEMKFEFLEGKVGGWITLKPETPAEAAKLLRLAKNAKRQQPRIYFSFGSDEPELQIHLEKKARKQTHSFN